jgi:hypothetical protein
MWGQYALPFLKGSRGDWMAGTDTPRGPAMYLGNPVVGLEEAHVRATKDELTKQYMAKRVTVRPIGPKFAGRVACWSGRCAAWSF